jgi:CRP/FNR family transcriptional regulator, cyclic AMP receptor protein
MNAVGEPSAELGRECLRGCGSSKRFSRGQHLLTAGTASDKVLLIESGVVKVVLSGRPGMESVAALHGRGTLIGERGVTTGQPRSAHVVGTLAGEAVHVSASVFLQLRDENPNVRALLEHTLRTRQRWADERLLAQMHSVRTRVVSFLLRWAHELGTPADDGLLMRGVSQKEIAQAVIASEKTVETVLGELRASGVLRTRRLGYLLTDPAELERSLENSDG